MRLHEVILTESFDWSSDSDQQTFMSLKGLVNKNNGVFKTRKQQWFVLNKIVKSEPDRDRGFVMDNFGITLDEDEKLVIVSAMTRWAEYGARSMVPVRFGFVVDPIGVVKLVKFGNKGNMRDGSSIDPKKNKVQFERPANVDAKHLEKSEEEKKKEFMVGIGMTSGNHVGEVGKRMDFGPVELVAKKYVGDSYFGYNQAVEKYWNMYKTVDDAIIYHTGKQGPEKGEKINLTATVKQHITNKKGEKVTTVIRPRFKAVEPITEATAIGDGYGYDWAQGALNDPDQVVQKIDIVNVFKGEGWTDRTKRAIASQVDEYINAALGWATLPRFQTPVQKYIRQALIDEMIVYSRTGP